MHAKFFCGLKNLQPKSDDFFPPSNKCLSLTYYKIEFSVEFEHLAGESRSDFRNCYH